MSTIVIVSICVAIAAVIGLRVYVEHKEEKDFEKLKQQVEEDKKNAAIFVQEEAIAELQPIHVEIQPVVEAPVHVESTTPVEVKPKKKRRYYGKPKAKKQTKNKS